MQALILLALVAASQATVLLGAGGASTQYRSQDNLGNYAFGYNEGHGSGASFRKESGSNGVVAGSYGLTVADGRQRIVNYVADAAGFRADVKTNEPGVEPKDPANVAINKALVAAPAVVSYAAPVAYSHPIAYAGHAIAPFAYAAAPASSVVKVASGGPLGGYSYSTVVGHHGLLGHHYVL